MIVFNRPNEVGPWVCERIGGTFHANDSTTIGYEVAGKLVAGVLFDSYRTRSLAIHVAGEGQWLTRGLIRASFRYAFLQLGVGKLIALIDSMNAKSIRLTEYLGFRLEATVTGAGKSGDLLIYTMTPDTCRWIGEK